MSGDAYEVTFILLGFLVGSLGNVQRQVADGRPGLLSITTYVLECSGHRTQGVELSGSRG